MALLVLLSTVSWTVDKHLCMGRVMDIALFGHAEDCGMESAMQFLDYDENHCCADESFTIEGQDDLKLTFSDLEIGQQLFLISFAFAYFDLLDEVNREDRAFIDYSPPPLIRDVQLLHQTFLI